MITQIAIMIFGASAIWFVGRKETWKRWGYILGLLGQPFWIYESYTNEQWGILIMTLFYAYSWIQGIINYWFVDDNKTGVPKMKNPPQPPKKSYYQEWMESEREKNLKLINETVPEIIQDLEKDNR